MNYNTIRYDTIYNELERFLGYAQKLNLYLEFIKYPYNTVSMKISILDLYSK
jgi:hypothetical protein